mmetsp:Transcript_97032/g.313328  ORF Transcript_97032/g.313328 Transcript_97032/m.313328 type:complete len:205 (+) Transcript_97032:517-1131(+)
MCPSTTSLFLLGRPSQGCRCRRAGSGFAAAKREIGGLASTQSSSTTSCAASSSTANWKMAARKRASLERRAPSKREMNTAPPARLTTHEGLESMLARGRTGAALSLGHVPAAQGGMQCSHQQPFSWRRWSAGFRLVRVPMSRNWYAAPLSVKLAALTMSSCWACLAGAVGTVRAGLACLTRVQQVCLPQPRPATAANTHLPKSS